MQKYKYVILITILLIIVFGCTKPRPLGSDYTIRVVADSTIWNVTEPVLRDIFERIERTPQEEKLFTIMRQTPEDYKRYKNLIFLSTLDAEDEFSQMVNENLSPQAREKVEEGEIMFSRKQVWAQDQMVVFLIGKDLPTLINEMKERKDDLFYQFEDYWRNFHKEILYSKREQIDVEKHLLKNYGWMLRVPIDYKMIVQSDKDRFVMFHRQYPLRWISVFWENATDPSVINKAYCIEKRNSYAETYFENEYVEQEFEPVIAEEEEFLGRRALYLKGLWGNDEKVAGGPFRMYCFFDQPTERIYFIDYHLFLPTLKKTKIHYLRQMDIVAHTFKTNLEVKPEELGKIKK